MLKKVLLFAVVSTLLFSCTKDEDENPASAGQFGIATITGQVKADLDLSQTNFEYVPSGTVIIAKIDINDLNIEYSQDGIDQGFKIYKTTVDENGRYSFNVDANAINVDITVMGEDFEYNQVVNDSLVVRRIFTLGQYYTTAVDGMNKVVDLNYTY
jgi:hypothetical protein